MGKRRWASPRVMKMLPMFPKVDPSFVPRILQVADFQAKKRDHNRQPFFVTFSSAQASPIAVCPSPLASMKRHLFFQISDDVQKLMGRSGFSHGFQKLRMSAKPRGPREELNMQADIRFRNDQGQDNVHRQSVQAFKINWFKGAKQKNGCVRCFGTPCMRKRNSSPDTGAHGIFPLLQAFIERVCVGDHAVFHTQIRHKSQDRILILKWNREKNVFGAEFFPDIHTTRDIDFNKKIVPKKGILHFQFVVPPSGGVTPPEGGTTHFP